MNKFNIERLEGLGITAKVVDPGKVYTTYRDFAKASGYHYAAVNPLTGDITGKSCRSRMLKGKIVRILAKGKHDSFGNMIYVIRNMDGEHFLIGEDGIEIIESSSEKSYDDLITDMTELLSRVHSRAFDMGYAKGYKQGKSDATMTELYGETPNVREAMARIGKELRKISPEQWETPQQARDRIIEQAKKDVEDLKCKDSDFYDLGKYACAADFIVNKEKRTVVALLRGYYSNVVRAKGIAKCAPGDCFNSAIGKAISLRRALGLEVPAEYLNTPQPTEVRVGDIIEYRWLDREDPDVEIVKVESIENGRVKYTCGDWENISEINKVDYDGHSVKVIDDSRDEANE